MKLRSPFLGPGFGECIVTHLGNNNWVIIDSCVDQKNKTCIPINYLKNINVDPKINVQMVIATHWHDDHIRGLSDLIVSCSNCVFVCSAALLEKDFLSFIKIYDTHTKIEESGVSEFSKILEILCERDARIIFAMNDKLLFNKSLDINGHNYNAKIFSLSPSDEDFKQAKLISR